MPKTKQVPLEQFEHVIADAQELNKILDSINAAVDMTEAVMSFRSRRLLERARDKIEEATLLLKEAVRTPEEGA